MCFSELGLSARAVDELQAFSCYFGGGICQGGWHRVYGAFVILLLQCQDPSVVHTASQNAADGWDWQRDRSKHVTCILDRSRHFLTGCSAARSSCKPLQFWSCRKCVERVAQTSNAVATTETWFGAATCYGDRHVMMRGGKALTWWSRGMMRRAQRQSGFHCCSY